jgi:hypothetical protein
MSNSFEVIKSDFNMASVAFNSGNYELMNIFANRLMSNALFGDNKLYSMYGVFIKEVAIDFLFLEKSVVEKIVPHGKKFFNEILPLLDSTKIDVTKIWDIYYEYIKETRKFFILDVEKKNYLEDPEITRGMINYIFNEMLKTNENLLDENSVILKGFLNELVRLINVYGISQRDVIIFILIRVFDRYFDYAIFSSTSQSKGIDKELLDKKISPFMDRIRELYNISDKKEYSALTPIASELICDIIIEWRKYFIKYLEIGRIAQKESRKIELSEDSKKKISETIATALQKDIGGKK